MLKHDFYFGVRKWQPLLKYDYMNSFANKNGKPILTNLGCAMSTGNHHTYSEDRIDYAVLDNNFTTLSDEKIRDILIQTATNIDNNLIYDYNRTGSTLIAAVCNKNKITTVNVGDSLAFAVIFDQGGIIVPHEQKPITRLNRILHKVTLNPPKKCIPNIANKYLHVITSIEWHFYSEWDSYETRQLAVYNSIGDHIFEEVGKICQPDVYVDTLNIPPGGKAIIIVASDGLKDISEMETGCQKLTEIYAACKNNPTDFAQQLVQNHNISSIRDDTSCIVKIIDPTDIQEYGKTTALAVYDGHGEEGWAVAETLENKYISEVNLRCQTSEISPEPSTKSVNNLQC